MSNDEPVFVRADVACLRHQAKLLRGMPVAPIFKETPQGKMAEANFLEDIASAIEKLIGENKSLKHELEMTKVLHAAEALPRAIAKIIETIDHDERIVLSELLREAQRREDRRAK